MSQRQLERHERMRSLLSDLQDPRYHDNILRYFKDSKVVYLGPVSVTDYMPRYATVCASEVTHVTHLAARSEPEFEVNDGWFIAAVYDLDTGERVDND